MREWPIKTLNTWKVRITIATLIGMPSYLVFGLIRNIGFDEMTGYAIIQYGLAATICFAVIFETQHQKSKWFNNKTKWKWDTKPTERLLGAGIPYWQV